MSVEGILTRLKTRFLFHEFCPACVAWNKVVDVYCALGSVVVVSLCLRFVFVLSAACSSVCIVTRTQPEEESADSFTLSGDGLWTAIF